MRTLRADVRRSRTTVAVPGQPDAAQRARTAFTVATQQGPVGCVSDWAVCARPLDFQVSGAVGRPVQLWHGDEDPVIPVHHAEHLLSLLPGAALHVWPGEGHSTTTSAGARSRRRRAAAAGPQQQHASTGYASAAVTHPCDDQPHPRCL